MAQIQLTELSGKNNPKNNLSELNAAQQKLVNGGLSGTGLYVKATVMDDLSVNVTSTVDEKEVVLENLRLSKTLDLTPKLKLNGKVLSVSLPLIFSAKS